MRLTVHVKDAKRESVDVRSKEKPGTFVAKTKTFTTLSFHNVGPEDVDRILGEITPEQGIPFKHYLSGDKVPGHSRGKKK